MRCHISSKFNTYLFSSCSRQTILASVFKLFIEAKKDGSHLKAKIGLLKLLHLMFLLMSINQNQLTILNDKDNHDKQNLAA
jgi:hypothetical protein